MIKEIKLNKQDLDKILNILPDSVRKELLGLVGDKQDLDKILNILPDSVRKELLGLVGEMATTDDPMYVIKQFVSQYDEEDVVDRVVAFTCSSLIVNITQAAYALLEKRKKQGDSGFCGMDMAKIVLKQLEAEGKRIAEALADQSLQNHNCNKH